MWAQLLAIPLTFLIKANWWDDDDDEAEDTMRFLRSFTMNLPAGFGATFTVDHLFMLVNIAFLNRPDLAIRSSMDILRILFPNQLSHGLTRDIIDNIVKGQKVRRGN